MTLETASVRAALAPRYAIGEELGRGGMAIVYQAHDPRHNRSVAIKVLRPELAVAVGAGRFLREIRIESRLEHPHILTLFDSGQAGEFLYYVMPYAEGGSLADRLANEQHIPIEEAIRIIREAGDALAHAHDHGIIHRDVKPANIMFAGGHAMIADFGIARAVADVDVQTLTESGVAIGTPGYMSPEQATGQDKVDPRADQYSLACVLFEMLAGEPPFTGRTAQAVVARHMSERPPSLAAVRPDLPPSLAEVIARALAKVPADRFANIRAFLAAIDAAVSGKAIPFHRRRLRTRRAAIAGIAAGTLGLGWWVLTPEPVELSRSRVAVFPLAARGPGVANTGAGTDVTYLIEAALEQAEPLRLIDVTSRLDERELANPEAISSASARRIARAQRAAYYLQGVVQGHRDSMTVILRLYDVAGDTIVAQHSAVGAVTEVPMHHLGIDAVKGLLPALIDPTRAVDLTPLRDRRATAIALWIQGEREYRHAKFTAALQLYERALGDDSALALAAVKGAQAASWVHDFPRGLKLVALALQHDSLLPRRYAVFARGLNGYFTGNADSAAHWLREVVALDRGWSEAAAALGEVYYHLLPSDAPLDSLARAAFTAAIIADSGFAPPLFHLLEAQLRDGALPDADRLIQRFREMEPDPQLLLQISLMRECVAAPAAMPWRERVQRNAVSVLLAGKALTGGGHQFACAEGAFRAILSSPTTGRGERWGAFLGLQGILVATGRDREARVLVDSVAVRTGAARSLYVLATAAGARMAEPAAALDSFARQLYGERYERIPNAENLWVIGLWHHSQGNVAGLRVVDSTLRARALGTGNPRDRYFATAVNARVALSTDSARAIELLRGLTGALRGDVEWAIGEAVPADHLLLATLLLARGAHQDAIRAASVFDHAQPIMFLPYVPLSLAIRYRASMALGDEAAARRYRARLNGLHRGELLNN